MSSSEKNPDIFIEKLYKEYSRLAMRAAYKILHDEYLAEDAFQLAFISISQNLGSLPENHEERAAYITRAVSNAAIDIYRKYGKIRNMEISIKDNENPGEEDEAVNSDGYFNKWRTESFEDDLIENMEIEKLFKELNKSERGVGQIIKLKIFNGLSMKEIAKIQNISEDTAWKRYYRCIRKLKKKLKRKK